MNKHEENVKKALMRGVCALNLEAMSIFDSEKSSNGPSANDHNLLESSAKNIPLNLNSVASDKELARKVKSYCETSLKRNENLSETANEAKMSALTKAKLQLSNLNSLSSGHYASQAQSSSSYSTNANDQFGALSSGDLNGNRVYSELIQHPEPVQPNVSIYQIKA
jgi:hypothetical protein